MEPSSLHVEMERETLMAQLSNDLLYTKRYKKKGGKKHDKRLDSA